MIERRASPEIIVVDEQDGLRWLYQHWLEADGYRVRVVRDRTSLEAALVGDSPDVILLDLHLGGLDGIRTCRDLKKDEHTAHIPVIGTTHEAAGMSTRLAAEAGANGVLAKPFSRIELELAVQEQLARARTPVSRVHQAGADAPGPAVVAADGEAIERQP